MTRTESKPPHKLEVYNNSGWAPEKIVSNAQRYFAKEIPSEPASQQNTPRKNQRKLHPYVSSSTSTNKSVVKNFLVNPGLIKSYDRVKLPVRSIEIPAVRIEEMNNLESAVDKGLRRTINLSKRSMRFNTTKESFYGVGTAFGA